MDQAKLENVLFFLTILNIVAGLVSISLATVATLAIREAKRAQTTVLYEPVNMVVHTRVNGWCQVCGGVGLERYTHRDSYVQFPDVRGHETPSEVGSNPVVRRSPMLSAQGRREFYG